MYIGIIKEDPGLRKGQKREKREKEVTFFDNRHINNVYMVYDKKEI